MSPPVADEASLQEEIAHLEVRLHEAKSRLAQGDAGPVVRPPIAHDAGSSRSVALLYVHCNTAY